MNFSLRRSLQTQPVVFCHRCHRYIGRASYCPSCGWERPRPIPAPGEPMWSISLETKLRSGLAVAGNLMFVGGEDGILWSFGALDGVSHWQQYLGTAIRDRPVTTEECVVAVTKIGIVFAFDTASGCELWQHPTGAPGTGAACIADGVVCVGDALGRLHALDLHSGRPIWSDPFAARKRIGAAPVVAQGMIIAGSYDGSIYAIDIQRGDEIWECALGDRITAAPVIVGNWAFVGVHDGRVVKLDLFAGRVRQRWDFTADSAILSDLMLSADERLLYAGSHGGNFYALDTQTAKVHYSFQANGAVSIAPALWEKMLFFGVNDGYVYALDANDGEELWRFDASSPVMGLTANKGVVYAATYDSTLFALPWHLGQWARMAQYRENKSRYDESAAFYALSGYPFESRRLFHRLGNFAVAAQVMEVAGERTEAAEDYRRAAEQAQQRGASEDAAGFYEQAADLFAQIRSDREAEICRDAAIRCRRAPFLRVDILNRPDLVLGETGVLQVRLTNVGFSKARDICGKLSGPCQCVYEFRSPELAQGRICNFAFENLLPTQAGQQLLFRLLLHYRAPEGRLYDYQVPLRLSVRTPEQPSVHIDEVIVVRGPMTRVEGSVGTVKQKGDSGLVDVKEDAGMVIQRSMPD